MNLIETIASLKTQIQKIKSDMVLAFQNKKVNVTSSTPMSEFAQIIEGLELSTGGVDVTYYKQLADEILGSVEADNEIRAYAQSLSDLCDEILIKESTFSPYSENDLDNFENLELLADEILEGE